MPSIAGIEYELIDDAPTIKWNGKYYREGIGEISEEEARTPAGMPLESPEKTVQEF